MPTGFAKWKLLNRAVRFATTDAHGVNVGRLKYWVFRIDSGKGWLVFFGDDAKADQALDLFVSRWHFPLYDAAVIVEAVHCPHYQGTPAGVHRLRTGIGRMKRPAIISLGEVLWDLFPDGERFGGAPANFACHAAMQGADVAMLSAVGDDRHGREAVSILSDYGIDISLIQSVPEAPTGTVGVELDNNGKPTFVIHEGSAWDEVIWNEEIAQRIALADAVCFGTLGQRSEVSRNTIRRTIETAAAAGIQRVVDINLRPPFFDVETIRDSIRLASILKLSDEELAEVRSACIVTAANNDETMLRGLLQFGELDMVLMTRGANGAVLVTRDSMIDQAGIPTTVTDTVGAGDAFTAAFLISELQGKPHKVSLRRACEVAAVACAHSGAIPEKQRTQTEQQR